MPSAVVPLPEASDRNVVILYRYADVQQIRIRGITPFEMDLRPL